jgi:hypothetical protein
MKKIGDLLARYFDEGTLKKVRGYGSLFSSWTAVAGERIAAHSRIVEMERSVLLVEADHPGWVQILQTEQKNLLLAVQRRFPGLDITAIAFRLSRSPEFLAEAPEISPEEREADSPLAAGGPSSSEGEPQPVSTVSSVNIPDEGFLQTLKSLESAVNGPRKRA